MHKSKFGSIAGYLLLAVITIAGFAAASPRALSSKTTRLAASEAFTLAEPTFTKEYLIAYSRGDEVAADAVASPLYRAQWSRLGLTPAARQALLPPASPSGMTNAWIHFDYMGGAADWRGFRHLLYVAHALAPGHPSPPSAWRLDTDRAGRVIWAEMVFLFSPEVRAVTTVSGDEVASRLPGLDPTGAVHPRLIAGVQAVDGREGYYVVVLPWTGAGPAPADADSVAFFGVDADGGVRPGAWTYGQKSNRPSEYGRTTVPPMVTLDAENTRIELSYLQALW